jgi:tetratricopeptide (TPR) repeat protein
VSSRSNRSARRIPPSLHPGSWGRRLGSRLVSAVYDRTQGVPFFVEEFASALAAAGRLEHADGAVELGSGETLPLPDTVKDAVLLRVERLSSVGRHSLEIAAAAGLRFDLELVVALGGADGIDEAIERGFLVEVDRQGAFRHDLIREAIYDDAAWTRRRTYHRRLAEELERRGAPPEAVVEQWLAGGEPDRARPSLLAAAERFCQVHAYHDAARAVRRAIEQWREGEDEEDRLAALERLGGYAQLHGDLGGALRAWQEVLEARRGRGDPITLAALERRLAGIYELQGAWDRALAARSAAADAFTERGMDFESATERLAAASHLQSAAKLTAALDLIASAASAVERTGSTELRVRALSLEGQIRTKLGDTERGVELAREGLALALAENLIEPAGEAYSRLASALEHASGYPEAIDAYSAAADFCHQQGLAGMAAVCFACLAPAMVKTGEWDRAVEVCRAILDVGGRLSRRSGGRRRRTGCGVRPAWPDQTVTTLAHRRRGVRPSQRSLRAGDRGRPLSRSSRRTGGTHRRRRVSCPGPRRSRRGQGGASLLRPSASLDHDLLRAPGPHGRRRPLGGAPVADRCSAWHS